MAVAERPECLDFLQFQAILKKMRELDDKIIYALNTSLPTESFKAQSDSSKACKELFAQLQNNFLEREEAIQKCISFARDKVLDLKKKKETNKDDVNVLKELRKEQSKLRLLQTELGVEEVVKDKTSKKPFRLTPYSTVNRFSNAVSEDTEFQAINIRKSLVGRPKSLKNIDQPLLYPKGRTVKKEKRRDMMDLLKFIPPVKHDYYKNLSTNRNDKYSS